MSDKKDKLKDIENLLLREMEEVRKTGEKSRYQDLAKRYQRLKGRGHLAGDTFEELNDKGVVRIPGTTEKIDTSNLERVKGVNTWQDEIASKRAKRKILGEAGEEGMDVISRTPIKKVMSPTKKIVSKVAKKGLKALPGIGGLIAALSQNDAMAAVPILGDSDPLGPTKGSPEAAIEDPSLSREERARAIEQLSMDKTPESDEVKEIELKDMRERARMEALRNKLM